MTDGMVFLCPPGSSAFGLVCRNPQELGWNDPKHGYQVGEDTSRGNRSI